MTPILPFFILDAMFQIYSKVVKPMDLKREQKMMRSRWIDAYNQFNRDFFSAFTDDQQDAIIDRMDDFCDYINNDVEIARVQVMNVMKEDGIDMQMTVSSVMLCNVLAQAANTVWRNTYVKRDGSPLRNAYIDAMERWSYKFMNAYHGRSTNVDPNKSEGVSKAVSALCRRIIRWLNEDFAKNG